MSSLENFQLSVLLKVNFFLTGKGREGIVTLTLIVVLRQHLEKTVKASANARTFLLIGLKIVENLSHPIT